jgi:hypothetical protein
MRIVHNLGIEEWGQPHDLLNADDFYYIVHEIAKDKTDPFVKCLFKTWNKHASLFLGLSNLLQKVF